MLKEILSKKKSSILEKWIKSIADDYPADASKFLRLQKDRFSNPLGYTISSSAENIFNEILNENNQVSIKASLRDIIKVKAVQEFSPSQAIEFIFSLKKVVREELRQEITVEKVLKELMAFESGIDDLALAAFDKFMEAREKIFQIRIKEIKAKILFNDANGVPEE